MSLLTKRSPCLLGIECGGTRTVALVASPSGELMERRELGPANLRLMNDAALSRHLRQLKAVRPVAVAIGMAGARAKKDRARILRAAGEIWPGTPCYATHDLETALESVERPGREDARVLVLSGTGSCCFGRDRSGRTVKMGGWGHLLGDKGSGYEIGLRSMKAVVYYYDRDGRWPPLGARILRALQLNEPDDLIDWAQGASKAEIAELAVEVFEAWRARDRIASDILAGAESSLVKDALACADRLVGADGRVAFVLNGGVLLRQPAFAARVRRQLRQRREGCAVWTPRRESAWGAIVLAARCAKEEGPFPLRSVDASEGVAAEPLDGLASSPTERRNPRSMGLDALTTREAVRLMLSEESRVPGALLRVEKDLVWAVDRIAAALRRRGRLFYVGAGTSGRLGVLDASECPPTFRTLPSMVQGIMAGGRSALWRSVEGAEDDAGAGGRAVEFRGVGRGDVVVGIAASGRTPFVLGALEEGRRRGALTLLLCFNPSMQLPRARRPHRVIAVDVGPEVLTGSTRLKSGTATKLVLNLFTTLAMVRLGKVKGNLMIDVQASNSKLRDRAVRMVCELTGRDPRSAREALAKSGWRVKEACGC